MSQRAIIRSYEAVGGPEKTYMADDGYAAGATNAGVYRMSGCGRHSSRA